MRDVQVRLLGAPEILRRGERQAVDTKKAIALVAVLASAEAPTARERLCAMFWPEASQSRARGALRRTLSTVRRLIGPEALRSDGGSISLDTRHLDVDTRAFEVGAGADSADKLKSAVDLYRGDLLDGFAVRGSPDFEDWHRVEAARLRRLADGALERLTELLGAAGDHRGAIGAAERRLALDALNEPAHQALILAEASAGRRDRAIERYRTAVRLFDEELGVGLLPQTTDLYEMVRRGEVSPPSPASESRPRPSPKAATGAGPSLIGREEELAALVEAYERAAYSGRVVGIAGEAGIGKTRLIEAMVERCRKGGATALIARCHRTEQTLSYALVVQILNNLGGDARPSLEGRKEAAVTALLSGRSGSDATAAGAGEGADRLRFLDSLLAAVEDLTSSELPALIAIDDFHFADDASAEFIGYLIRRIQSTRILLVIGWRPENLPAVGPVRSILDGALAEQEVRVMGLQRLSAEAVREIAGRAAGGTVDDQRLEDIIDRSRGVPLFAVALASATDEGTGGKADAATALYVERVAATGPVAEQVLAAAAVIGRSFSPRLVQEVCGRTGEEVEGSLDELEELGVLRREEQRPTADYDFAFGMWRDFAYETLGPGRRRLLHRRAADALAARSKKTPVLLGEAATHAEAAGDRESAAEHFFAAAHAARAVHANAEAERWYSAALTLGHRDGASIREALGDLATLRGEYTAATTEYEAVAAVSGTADRSRIERKLAGVYSRKADWRTVDSFLRAALDLASDDERPGLLCDMAVNLHRLGREDEAVEAANAAMAAGRSGDRPGIAARAANTAGLLARYSGSHDEALDLLHAALSSARVARDEEMIVAIQNNLALTHHDRSEFANGLALLDSAIERCRRLGDRHRQAALLSNRGDALFGLGDAEGAADSVKRSAALMAEIGDELGRLAPEVWLLQEW